MRRRRPPRGALLQLCAISASTYTQVMMAVALVLLLNTIFLIPQPHHVLPIDRYRSPHAIPLPQALRDDAMTLTLLRDGTLYFGNAKVTASDLPGFVDQRVKTGSPRKVFFLVDVRAKYQDVSVAWDQLQHAGIWDVAFLTELPPREPRSVTK